MSQFDNLHRVLEAAKHVMSEYDDDFAEIQMILDIYEKKLGAKQEPKFPIKGTISFYFETGHVKEFNLGQSVRGLQFKCKRPLVYMISLDRQNILSKDLVLALEKLREYIYNEAVPALEVEK